VPPYTGDVFASPSVVLHDQFSQSAARLSVYTVRSAAIAALPHDPNTGMTKRRITAYDLAARMGAHIAATSVVPLNAVA
jgi:hypothetical protein